jgi:hypothetical protein
LDIDRHFNGHSDEHGVQHQHVYLDRHS